MDQLTFSEAEYNVKKRKTRRELFLEKMDRLIPWKKLERQIAPHYPKPGNGRRPYPLSTMLRVHCMQLFYNLSDPAMEDALYEIESMRRFASLRLSGPLPDETTILNFRHLLERDSLGERLFETINRHIQSKGLILKGGSIIDASIIEAPTSTKNQTGKRDPEMHQTKKGQQWHFGMKLHIGTDDVLGLVHSFTTTSANEHDITQADQLLHGEENRVWADAGYTGIEKRPEHSDRKVDWFVVMRPGKRRQLDPQSDATKREKTKAQIRAKGEHPFLCTKRILGYAKVRYRGLHKNTQRLGLLLGFGNLIRAKDYLLA